MIGTSEYPLRTYLKQLGGSVGDRGLASELLASEIGIDNSRLKALIKQAVAPLDTTAELVSELVKASGRVPSRTVEDFEVGMPMEVGEKLLLQEITEHYAGLGMASKGFDGLVYTFSSKDKQRRVLITPLGVYRKKSWFDITVSE